MSPLDVVSRVCDAVHETYGRPPYAVATPRPDRPVFEWMPRSVSIQIAGAMAMGRPVPAPRARTVRWERCVLKPAPPPDVRCGLCKVHEHGPMLLWRLMPEGVHFSRVDAVWR